MKPYRTTIDEVPLEQGLREDEGWIDMQVQFLIDARAAGSDQLVVGRTVLPPGARHEKHAHPNCDEFLVVISGRGEIYTDTGREPSQAGDVVFTPRGHWHGFDNTGDEDVLLIWGWSGAGSLEAAGYTLPRVIGWKVGFGSPAALERLGLERPLVAPLPEEGVLVDGATVDLSSWTSPVLEAEVAVYAGRGLGVAIELADVDFAPDDVARILAGGIYHRHVLLGPPGEHTLAGVTARVLRDGEEIAATDDLTALTGSLDFVLETVRLHAGRELHDGELVIAGSVVPPQPIAPGEHWRIELLPLGTLEVRLAP